MHISSTSRVWFQGTIRNGREVAVKVLSAESRQGIREFLTEIDVISNVKHPNLVELVGCCVEANNRILVYEYLQNSSLDRALLGMNHTFCAIILIMDALLHDYVASLTSVALLAIYFVLLQVLTVNLPTLPGA